MKKKTARTRRVGTPAGFIEALLAGRKRYPTRGLCGRVIRGKKDEDFLTLTDDPARLLVMLVGPGDLRKMLGRTDYQKLITIGYDLPYIRRKVIEEGNMFKLVVFSESASPARKATWRNVIDAVSKAYPKAAAMFEQALPQLERLVTPACPNWTMDEWYKLERENYGYDLSEVDKTGPADPRFMTIDRLLASPGTYLDVRAFLYFTVHLRELFAGDGLTYTNDREPGLEEWIAPNLPIADLGEHAIMDMAIQVPESAQ